MRKLAFMISVTIASLAVGGCQKSEPLTDASLAQLDQEIEEAFSKAKYSVAMSAQEQMIDDQNEWKASVRKNCSNNECAVKMYNERKRFILTENFLNKYHQLSSSAYDNHASSVPQQQSTEKLVDIRSSTIEYEIDGTYSEFYQIRALTKGLVVEDIIADGGRCNFTSWPEPPFNLSSVGIMRLQPTDCSRIRNIELITNKGTIRLRG